ncbi:MAG TPA: acetylornithine transaminase [Sphingobacteriaceae bacterium]|nr:acetylornithine transaminase [Sphingobacteriaceae bacterium]
MTDWLNRDKEVFLQVYNRYPLMLVRGSGSRVWDDQGREYLDFLCGIGVTSLGHCHPDVVEAITRQAATLIHTSNLFHNGPALELGELLINLGALDRVFFSNSGAEATEGAIKLARKYHWRQGRPERNVIVSMTGSFHGRTLGALAATAKPEIQEGFGPLPGGFKHVQWNDVEALDAALDDQVAALILEPVQGEGGIHVADPQFMHAARALTAERGILLIVDEIQCGIGRTGSMFAHTEYGIRPDIMLLAKALGSGLPIGAICATEEAAQGFAFGDHGTTFGSNPVACAAATATLRAIVRDDLARHAGEMGRLLMDLLQARLGGNPAVTEIRGKGLMVGIQLTCDAQKVLAGCRDRGLLANVTSGSVLRLLPPLIVTEEEIRQSVEIIGQAIEDAVAAQ